MLIHSTKRPPSTQQAKPTPPPAPPSSALGEGLAKLEVLGSATIADTTAALGVAASQACGAQTPVLNVAMAGIHGLRAAAFLANARGKTGHQLQQRMGVAIGEGLMAAGNALAFFGQDALSIPVLVAGAGVNLVADYRYRSAHESDSEKAAPAPTLGKIQKAVDLGDAALTLSTLSPQTSLVGGFLGAGAHLGMSVACYAGKGGLAADNTHSEHSKGYAHAMMAAGMIAAAAGSGGWSLVPILSGSVGLNLQDIRDSKL